jgi:asparagine synthase (glutamine-hydrolysing)
MCAITGIVRLDGLQAADRDLVRRMMELQLHRGPDDEGLYLDRHAAMGHRRLSIIDRSAAGRQPMSNEDGSLRMVCNGEIYNFVELREELRSHLFQSNSDSEVLLHGYEEWGIEALLRRVRGMFALAIWDAPNRKLILARDRFGIKPLYYAESAQSVMFASEVRALTRSGAVDADADREALAGFLLLGSVPSPLTCAKSVRCLPPAHYAVFDAGGFAMSRYWSLDPRVATTSSPEEMRAALKRSVAGHLISDVPVGVFLSGGVDSAAILALSARERAELTTLTVTFAEEEFDESQEARQLAERLRTRHCEVRITSRDFLSAMPAFLASLDQPTNDGINSYFVSRAAKQCGLTVALSGLGGDEVFWGYPHYRRMTGRFSPVRLLTGMPRFVQRPAWSGAASVGRLRGRESWMRLRPLAKRTDAARLYFGFRGFFAPEQAGRLLGASSREIDEAVERHLDGLFPQAARPRKNAGTTVDDLSRIEFRRYLHDQLLRDTDVFSMAHSIEVRVPFLDHEVVECAARVPASLKMGRAINKPLLVAAACEEFVAEAGARPKRGFSLPMDRWMKQHADNLGEMARQSALLDRKETARLWRAFERGRLHWSRAWALTVMGAWS